jgi:hypothetical protein
MRSTGADFPGGARLMTDVAVIIDLPSPARIAARKFAKRLDG